MIVGTVGLKLDTTDEVLGNNYRSSRNPGVHQHTMVTSMSSEPRISRKNHVVVETREYGVPNVR